MSQRDALIRLLRDNDPATVSLLKEQLIGAGAMGSQRCAICLRSMTKR
jgi:hypothetical protein